VDDSRDTTHRILQAQSGDREALDELFRRIQRPLYGYLCRLTGDRARAEDLLQVYRIASREVMKRIGAERRWRTMTSIEATVEEMAAAPSPDTFMPELLPRLPELVGQLSPASREVIVLHYMQAHAGSSRLPPWRRSCSLLFCI